MLLLGCAIALCALLGDGRLDLAISRWFFDGNAFPLANHWLLKNLLHDAARTASAIGALLLLASTAAGWATPRARRLNAYRRELLFTSAATVAAALIVAALKHFSSHACPWDFATFGGTVSRALAASGKAAAVQGCLPAAHPVAGYAWLAAGFSLHPFGRRLAGWSWGIAFAAGTTFGVVQIARGAHFLSHVLWSAWVVWAVNLGLLAALTWLPVITRVGRRRFASLRGHSCPGNSTTFQ